MSDRFESFADFYPFYLEEHTNLYCRRLHFIGTSLGLFLFVMAFMAGSIWFIFLGLLVGYGFAWVGHFVFEKNRPATFQYPLYSFLGDWVMWKDILTGRIKF